MRVLEGWVIKTQADFLGMFPGFLPLRLIWLASLVTSFSGSELAFYAFTFAVAADVTSEKRM